MKHPHYDMIVAKAANMELTKFAKRGPNWLVTQMDSWGNADYFLCLPQHKEVCLHWLEGGEFQWMRDNSVWEDAGCPKTWSEHHVFMSDCYPIRIKARIESRWIIAKPSALASMMYFDSRERTEHAVKNGSEFAGGQVIEIGVNL